MSNFGTLIFSKLLKDHFERSGKYNKDLHSEKAPDKFLILFVFHFEILGKCFKEEQL